MSFKQLERNKTQKNNIFEFGVITVLAVSFHSRGSSLKVVFLVIGVFLRFLK